MIGGGDGRSAVVHRLHFVFHIGLAGADPDIAHEQIFQRELSAAASNAQSHRTVQRSLHGRQVHGPPTGGVRACLGIFSRAHLHLHGGIGRRLPPNFQRLVALQHHVVTEHIRQPELADDGNNQRLCVGAASAIGHLEHKFVVARIRECRRAGERSVRRHFQPRGSADFCEGQCITILVFRVSRQRIFDGDAFGNRRQGHRIW